ncbi:hypothetical protein BDV18DRAFT_138682 [Aspergillus unguis]
MSVPPPSAATQRSSLNVPATQNTAPVVKFRCLFTHDMRRKAKRWQDGFLRFHTFNKRVMVYDNTGYFVGDLHWRAPEGIQDGDELELDKGVLIQVCEPLEKTETDLSALYQNKSQNSPSHPANAKPPPSSVRSTSKPTLSQQAPRSLNDLLGIKKPGTPQMLSPYEQRNGQRPSTIRQLNEQPRKRQRISPEPSRQVVVDLSDSTPSSKQQSVSNALPDPPSRPQVQPKPQDHSVTLSSERHSSARTKQLQASASRVVQPAQTHKPSSSTEAPTNTLRLASGKPRRKLMYQEPTAPLKSEPRSQLSRTHSQQKSIKPDMSSPVIVLDDDPPPAQPTIPRPSRTDLTRSISMVDTVDDPDADGILPLSTSSDDEFPLTSKASVPLPQREASSSVQHEKPPGTTPNFRSAGLRKSFSDPTTINAISNRPLAATSPLNPTTDLNDEQGPWTSEALDLFDFWPPGRPKPV